jgi:ubiquinone/menaquinone biosynthesis C-methylase UbiE
MKQWIRIERIPGPLASSYEKASRMVIDSYYSEVAAEIVSSGKSGLMLDLGCGPGYLSIEIVKQSTDINIVGVDLCGKLVQTARANVDKANLADRLRFEIGNAGKLRFNDASFDMVLSTGMLHSLKNPLNVLKEIHRVLKKDGMAWIYDPASVSSKINKAEWRASLTSREKFFLALFKLLGLLKPIQPHTRDQVVPMIESVGYESYDIKEGDGEIKIILQK